MMNKLSNQKENPKKQVEMTHQEYDELVNSIIEMGYLNENWYPDEKDVLKLAEDPVDNLEFALWILNCSSEQKLTEEQKKIEKSIKKFVDDTIVFVD